MADYRFEDTGERFKGVTEWGTHTPIMELRMQTRPVSVRTDYGSWTGYFHRYVDIEGSTYALIENEQGELHRFDVRYGSITFLDRMEQP